MKRYQFLLLTFLWSFAAFSETYLEYVKRINSVRHILKSEETLLYILKSRGYGDLKRHGGDLDQTLWKNGIGKDEWQYLQTGTEILLPYYKDKIKRKIASEHAPTVKKKEEKSHSIFASIDFRLGMGFFSIESQDNSQLNGVMESRSYRLAELRYTVFTLNGGSLLNKISIKKT